MGAKTGRKSTWTAEADAALLRYRDGERLFFSVIAALLGRSLQNCHRRYRELTACREFAGHQMALRPVAVARLREPLHRQLGIRTHTRRVAILDNPMAGRRYDLVNRAWNHDHLYRESVTLAGAPL